MIILYMEGQLKRRVYYSNGIEDECWLDEEQRRKAKIVSFADFHRDNFVKRFRAFTHIHTLHTPFREGTSPTSSTVRTELMSCRPRRVPWRYQLKRACTALSVLSILVLILIHLKFAELRWVMLPAPSVSSPSWEESVCQVYKIGGLSVKTSLTFLIDTFCSRGD